MCEGRAEFSAQPSTEQERVGGEGKKSCLTVDLTADAQELGAQLDVLAAVVLGDEELVAVAYLAFGDVDGDGPAVSSLENGSWGAGELLDGQVIGQISRAGREVERVPVRWVCGRAVEVDCRAAEEQLVYSVPDLCREVEEVGASYVCSIYVLVWPKVRWEMFYLWDTHDGTSMCLFVETSCTSLSCTSLSCMLLSCKSLSCMLLFCMPLSCMLLSCMLLSCMLLSCKSLSCTSLPCMLTEASCMKVSCVNAAIVRLREEAKCMD